MLDTFTLYSIIVATTLVGAVLVGVYGRRTPEAVGVASWIAGGLLLGVYFFCLVIRPWLPAFVSVSLANGFVVLGLGLMHRSACQISGRRWPVAWHLAAFVFIVATFALFFGNAQPGFRQRVILSSTVTAAQAVLIAFTFSQRLTVTGHHEQRARKLAVWLFGTIALVQMARAVLVAPASATLDVTLVARNLISYFSAAWFLLFSLALPFLITYINEARVQHELSRAVADLQTALAEVKTLRGLIPICASCRRIREVDDQWVLIERYLKTHADVELAQGLCPDCQPMRGAAPVRGV